METKHALWKHEDARRTQWRVLEHFSAGDSGSVGQDLQEYVGDKENDFISAGFLTYGNIWTNLTLV